MSSPEQNYFTLFAMRYPVCSILVSKGFEHIAWKGTSSHARIENSRMVYSIENLSVIAIKLLSILKALVAASELTLSFYR